MTDHDLALLESARKTLNAPDSSLQDLITASSIVANARRKAETELQAEEAARAKTLTSSHAKAADLDEVLRRHDDASATIRRRAEIAGATETALLNRINAMKEAEAVRQQLEFYNATVERRTNAVASIAPALAKMTEIARQLMRGVAEADRDIVKANDSLPSGCAPLAMLDAARRLLNPEPSLRELRRGRYYVDSGGGRVLGAETQVNATLRQDGRYDVMLPGGATSGGISTIATLHEFVEAELAEYPSPPWPEQLATALKIPGLTLADPPGWEIVTDRGEPDLAGPDIRTARPAREPCARRAADSRASASV